MYSSATVLVYFVYKEIRHNCNPCQARKKNFKCGTKGSPIVLTAVIWVKKFVNWCTGVRIAGILVHTFIPKVTLQTKVTDELTTIF